MNIELKLSSIKYFPEEITFEIEVNATRNIDNLLKSVQALVMVDAKGKMNELTTDISLEENKLNCSISPELLDKIISKNSLNLLFLLGEDAEFINLRSEHFNEFVYYNNSIYNIISDENNIIYVSKEKNDMASIQTITNDLGGSFKLIGKLKTFENINSRQISFYLEHELTYEILPLNHVNDQSEMFTIILSNDKYLYDGNWILKARISMMQQDINTNLTSEVSQTKQGQFIKYNDRLYYHEIMIDRNKLTVRTKPHLLKNIKTAIQTLYVENNRMFIEGTYAFNSVVTITDKLLKIKFVNRNIKKQFISNLFVKDEKFMCEIDFSNSEIVDENGIWDAYIIYEFNGIILEEKVDFGQSSIDYISLPMGIHNSNNLKKIRPYLTKDRNLALLIRNCEISGEIDQIIVNKDSIDINGMISIQDIPFKLDNIFLEDGNITHKIPFTLKRISNSKYEFSVNIQVLNIDIERVGEIKYSFKWGITVSGREYILPIVSNNDDILNKNKVNIYPPLIVDQNGLPLNITPNYNHENELQLSVSNALSATCETIKKRKNCVEIGVNIKHKEEPFNKLLPTFILVNKETDEEITISEDTKTLNNLVTFKFDPIIMNNLEHTSNLNNSKWNLYLKYNIGSNIYLVELLVTKKNLIKGFSTFRFNAIQLSSNLFASLLIDDKKSIHMEIREFTPNEKLSEKMRFSFAKLIAKSLNIFNKKPVWLIGENLGEVAQDNGFAFFKHLADQKVKEDYFYVSVPENKNKKNLEPYFDRVLKYDSFKHLVMYHRSRYLIVSHGIRDVIPTITHKSMGNNPKSVIYLQHGIIAMKKLNFNKNSYNGKVKKFVVSSTFEKSILINKMNFRESQIMVTGLSRFDSLVDSSHSEEPKQILVMPTWRDWINDSRKDFLESDFYKNYISLLKDEEIHTTLDKANLILKFAPHYEIQKKYKEDFQSIHPRIKVVDFSEESVKELMQTSSMLITDYSSVVFDFNYMNKPVLFYQFDLNDYLKHRGSYVDLSKDLIGDNVASTQELIEKIQEAANNDFKYNKHGYIKSRKYYAYRDKNNSSRIYNEILRLDENEV
ncbi:CDP-glycerol glycerophosphotransferase family protein [Alkalicoccobacillus gibsonii]|uniref:CDP-glycerol glycerophosphotransferase family protein n=1 Tax=Alkalicoccobacillus gibsonii TaxID=79881 RepID=UPI003F7C1161